MFLALVTGAEAGYLAKVGPSSIRVQEPGPARRVPALRPVVTPSATNALPETNAIVPVAIVATPAPETITIKSPTGPEEERADEGAGPTFPSPIPWAAPAPADHTMVTPQMLVPFFFHKTTDPAGTESGVIGPLSFTPPRPGRSPSSKAVLKTD